VAGRPGSHRARLLVLGAGPAQLGLLEAAAAREDVHVIAVDRDPNAVGFPHADERAILSSEDETGIDRLARALAVDGIVSPGADWSVGIAARVAGRMGLPHPLDPATAAVATSKSRQRERFAEATVPHARGFDTRDGGPPPLPVVVKAPDRQGQRGLTLVRRVEELEPALADARREARGGGVLVEELVEGPELTVNAISVDGRFVPVLVTDRVTAEPPAFGVALAHVWPPVEAVDAVVDVARAAVDAIGVENGPTYTQLRVAADGPVVMEVAARLGGGHDAELARLVTGVDLAGLAVAFALGETVDAGEVERAVRELRSGVAADAPGGACVSFIVPPTGTLLAVAGVGAAEQADGVEWVRIYRRPGFELGPLRRGADRAGAVLVAGDSRADALARARSAADHVRLVVG
jgi:biotin carboxylase